MFCKRGTLKNLIKLSWKLLKFRLTIKLLKFQAFVHILHCSNQSVDAMLCVICYHLHNLKNVKSTLGGVLLSVKLQAETYNFTQKFSLHTFSERKEATISFAFRARIPSKTVFLGTSKNLRKHIHVRAYLFIFEEC